MDREKQKKLERERLEKQRAEMENDDHQDDDDDDAADEEGGGPRVPRKSKFVSVSSVLFPKWNMLSQK